MGEVSDLIWARYGNHRFRGVIAMAVAVVCLGAMPFVSVDMALAGVSAVAFVYAYFQLWAATPLACPRCGTPSSAGRHAPILVLLSPSFLGCNACKLGWGESFDDPKVE